MRIAFGEQLPLAESVEDGWQGLNEFPGRAGLDFRFHSLPVYGRHARLESFHIMPPLSPSSSSVACPARVRRLSVSLEWLKISFYGPGRYFLQQFINFQGCRSSCKNFDILFWGHKMSNLINFKLAFASLNRRTDPLFTGEFESAAHGQP